MMYLVHTPDHARPFLSTLTFIAEDFRKWGYRVDCHAGDSKYMTEIRLRERIMKETEWRVELMEIWAQEVLHRRQERERGHQIQTICPADEQLSQEERRFKRASDLVQDFVDGVAAFGECGCTTDLYLLTLADRSEDKPGTSHAPFRNDPRSIPPSPLGLITKCMRLLQAMRYTPNAALPTWSNTDIVIADKVTLEFNPKALKKEHLVHAVTKAIGRRPGRIGHVERDWFTGFTKVVLFVDVSDDLLPRNSGNKETQDPPPVYERGEGPPPYTKD